ncbi:MAG: hypothetical protein JSW25_03290 [Thermoplasmata archaeon]|nr:MAG: hypothetical protein JSW25_03290 [Thermoplasmata archaeon]
MRGRILIASVLLIWLVLLASPAIAEKEEGTTSIALGDAIVVGIDVDGSTNIKYDVEVNSGPNVNVYFMDGSDYFGYKNGPAFEYYVFYSHEDVSSASEDFVWSEDGTYYVVIDTKGTANPDATTRVTYMVEWTEPSIGYWLTSIGICVAIILVVIVLMYVRVKARKKMFDQPVPPPMVQQQGYQYQEYQHAQYDQQAPPRRPLPPSDQGPGYVPPESGYERRPREPPPY